jgi:hypothetical protein
METSVRKLLTLLVALAAIIGATASSFGQFVTLGAQGCGGAGCSGGGSSTTTLNPSDKSATTTLSGGNLTATQATGYGGVRSISSYSSGKKYLEYVPTAGVSAFDNLIGIANAVTPLDGSNTATAAGWFEGSTTVSGNGGNIGTGMATYGVSNNIGMAVDIGNSTIWFRINGGTWNNSGTADPATNTGGFSISYMTGSPIFVWVLGNGASSAVETVNFGGSAYSFTPPSGFGNW